MGKYTFEDVHIKKIYGEVKECNKCHGSGILQYEDECGACEGKGFVKIEE